MQKQQLVNENFKNTSSNILQAVNLLKSLQQF